jgi:hypothetical protein
LNVATILQPVIYLPIEDCIKKLFLAEPIINPFYEISDITFFYCNYDYFSKCPE